MFLTINELARDLNWSLASFRVAPKQSVLWDLELKIEQIIDASGVDYEEFVENIRSHYPVLNRMSQVPPLNSLPNEISQVVAKYFFQEKAREKVKRIPCKWSTH